MATHHREITLKNVATAQQASPVPSGFSRGQLISIWVGWGGFEEGRCCKVVIQSVK